MKHNTAYQIKSPSFSIMKIEISTKSRAIFINSMSVAECECSLSQQKYFLKLRFALVSIAIKKEN